MPRSPGAKVASAKTASPKARPPEPLASLAAKSARAAPAKTAKPMQIGPKEFRIGFHVHDVSRMRRTLFDLAMKPLGITRSQWWALAQLSRSDGHDGGQGILQSDLARILEVGKVTIGGLIDRLEASGFVQRTADKVDRRARRIVITRDGRQVLDKMVVVGRRLNLDILEGLSERDIRIAESVLAKMKANIREKLAPLRGVAEVDLD